MTEQTGTKKRNVRRILIVITVLAVVVTAAAVGGSFGYAAYQKGRYVNVQDGYILNPAGRTADLRGADARGDPGRGRRRSREEGGVRTGDADL